MHLTWLGLFSIAACRFTGGQGMGNVGFPGLVKIKPSGDSHPLTSTQAPSLTAKLQGGLLLSQKQKFK